jgi:hypothetical protein
MKICFQEIGEEEKLKNSEHDKEFHNDNDPQFFPDGHIAKTIIIEIKYP